MRIQLAAAPLAVLMLLFGATVGMLRLMSMHGVLDGAVWGSFYGLHGKLMIFAFLAPLIALERWVGSRMLQMPGVIDYMPLLYTAGGLLKFLGGWLRLRPVDWVGTALIVIASVIFLYLQERLLRVSTVPSAFRLMQLGTGLLLLTAVLTLFYHPQMNLPVTLLMLGFPVFTVLGERVELVRIAHPEFAVWGYRAFWIGSAASLLLLAGVFFPSALWLIGLAAAALMGVAIPLWSREPAVRRRGQTGLARYMAAHLRWAYLWLAAGAALALAYSIRPSHALFDAASHSVALGFTLTMILGHAPVILPAIIRRSIKERALVLGPLWLLQAGVAMRVGGYVARVAGLNMPAVIGWSGLLALLAVIGLAAMLARAVERTAWATIGAAGAGRGR